MNIGGNAVKSVEITEIIPVGRYGEVVRERKKVWKGGRMDGLKRCYLCDDEFETNDSVYMAAVRGFKLVFLCKKCVDALGE